MQVCPVMLSITSRMVKKNGACYPNYFQHMSFWCPFLDSHPTIHHSNTGAHLRSDTNYTHLPCKHVVVNGKKVRAAGAMSTYILTRLKCCGRYTWITSTFKRKVHTSSCHFSDNLPPHNAMGDRVLMTHFKKRE